MPNDNHGFTRRPRANPPHDWIVREDPDLRIVDQELWDRSKVRQSAQRAIRDERFQATGASWRAAARQRTPVWPRRMRSLRTAVPRERRWPVALQGGPRRPLRHRSRLRAPMLEFRALAGLRERLLTPDRMDRFAAACSSRNSEPLPGATGIDDRAALEANCRRCARGWRTSSRNSRREDDVPRSLSAAAARTRTAGG